MSAHLRPTQEMRDADSFMVRKIGVSNRRGSGAAGISIVENVLNGDADPFGRSLRSTATAGNPPQAVVAALKRASPSSRSPGNPGRSIQAERLHWPLKPPNQLFNRAIALCRNAGYSSPWSTNTSPNVNPPCQNKPSSLSCSVRLRPMSPRVM